MTGLRSIAVKFGAFAALSGLLLVLLVNTMLNGVPGGKNTFYAEFEDVSGLRVGDDVKAAGVRVGRIDGIEVEGEVARVELSLQDDQPLLDNTALVMRYQNLVGQRYVAMVQPEHRGTELAPGAVVPADRTDPGFDLTELLNGFRPLFEVLQPGDVNRLATSIVKVLQGEGGTVEALLQETAQLTTFIAQRDQVIGEVLTNLTPVLTHLSGRGDDFSATVRELRTLMEGLAKDRESIGASVDAIGQLVGTTESLLTEAQRPLVLAVARLRQVAALLMASRGDLVGAIDGFSHAAGGLGRATSYQSALNVYLCGLQIAPGGGQGIDLAAGSTRRSEVCR